MEPRAVVKTGQGDTVAPSRDESWSNESEFPKFITRRCSRLGPPFSHFLDPGPPLVGPRPHSLLQGTAPFRPTTKPAVFDALAMHSSDCDPKKIKRRQTK